MTTGPQPPADLPADDEPPTDSPEHLQPAEFPPADDATGPPGATVFSLERRPAAGLYLVAWLLIGAGIGLTFIGLQAAEGLPRLLALAGLVVLALGLATAAGYQILARSDRPASAYRGPSPVLLFLLVIVVVNLFGGLLSAFTGIGGLDVDRPDVFVIGLLIQVFGYAGAVALFVVGPRALSWREMLRSGGRRARGALGDAATAFGVMLPVTLVALIVGGLVAQLIGARPPQVVPLPQTPFDIALDVVAAVVLAPIGEELFFRGFALSAWLRDLGPRRALIRSAVFFALVHVLNVRVDSGGFDAGLRSAVVLLVVILPIGVVLGGLYLRRGLVASVAAHMTYNGIIFGLLLLTTLVPLPQG